MSYMTQSGIHGAVFAATVATMLLASPLLAQQTDEELGRQIAEEADRRDLGWGTTRASCA